MSPISRNGQALATAMAASMSAASIIKKPISGTPLGSVTPDLLTILLVFLLKSYSTDTPVRPGDASFELPMSTSEQPMQRTLAVDLTAHGIYLQDQRIAGTRYYLEQEDTLIKELYRGLQQLPGDRIQVRVDADLPYSLTRKALFTAKQAGKRKVTVVTVSRSSL